MLITFDMVKSYELEIIRSQTSNLVMIEYEEGSTTRGEWT